MNSIKIFDFETDHMSWVGTKEKINVKFRFKEGQNISDPSQLLLNKHLVAKERL